MARLTEKDLKRLTAKTGFKATLVKPTPRWKVGDRQAKKTAKAWNTLLKDRLPE